MNIDYSKIAPFYDMADFRKVNKIDSILFNLLTINNHISVLDLGCGTGNYIKAHGKSAYNNITFYGLDNSIEMLLEAKTKNQGAFFIRANVCNNLPFKSNIYDYVICRFSFHHFDNKRFVLNEIKRCLKNNGVLCINDVDPYSNKKWWVYNLFPEIISKDKKRFWLPMKIKNELEKRGFSVKIKRSYGREVMGKNKLLKRLKIRDTSQLHMVPDCIIYDKINEIESWPANKTIIGDYSYIKIIGKLF